MADPKAAAGEPSMEEILASIRRIISEDGGEAGKTPPAAPAAPPPAAAAPPPPPQAAPPPPPPPPPMPEPEPEPIPMPEPEPEPEPELEPEPEPEPEPVLELTEVAEEEPEYAPRSAMADLEALVSDSTAAASAQAIHSLTRVTAGSRTLEDVVKECLRPLLKEWLDRNLTALVERLVQKEIRRITGQMD